MNLREDLHRVAAGAPVEPIAMAGVRAKARAIRRRRTGAAAGGAALGVAAIAAAAVLLVPGSADRTNPLPSTHSPSATQLPTSTGPTPSPGSTQSPRSPRSTQPSSPTAASSATVDRVVPLVLTNVPAERTTGASVAVPNWMNGSLTDARGNAIQVSTPVHHAVRDPASGDWFGMTSARGRWTWTQWSARGAVVLTKPSPGDRVAVSTDGKTWAVMVVDAGTPQIWVYHAGAAAPTVTSLQLPQGEPQDGAGIDAVLPDGTILFDAAVGDVRFGPPTGPFSPLSNRFETGLGANPDNTMILAAQVAGGHTCTVFETETGHTTGGDCSGDNQTYLPNADGSLVVRVTYGAPDIPVSLSVGTSPAGGQPGHVTEFDLQGARIDIADGAWMGSAYVAPVWSNGTWQLVWLSRDGYQITRSLSTQGSSAASPYLLGAGPLTATNP